MNTKKILRFVASLLYLFSNQKTFCAKGVDDIERIERMKEERYFLRSGYRDSLTGSKIKEKKSFVDLDMKTIDMFIAERVELNDKNAVLNAESARLNIENALGTTTPARQAEIAARQAEIATRQAKIDTSLAQSRSEAELSKTDLDNYRALIRNKSTTGVILAKIFAGSDRRNQFNEDEIDSWYTGLWEGMSVPLSEVMKDKAKATINASVGSLWDFLFAKLSDFGSLVRNVLFHDNNEPFDYQKLDGWQKMIMAAYDDIDNMLRNGLRDSTRSLDSVSRQFDDNGTEVQVKKEIDMWASLASGYAEQFAYFVTLFEKRREYYDEDDIVAFYSNQICQMLQTTCKLLTNSKSLKDLDTKLESQRTIIPAIKKNLWNLFEQLKAEVKPKSYSMKDTVTSTASTYKPSPYNAYAGSNSYGYNNDGPTSFAGGF